MTDLRDLYQELILDHTRSPRNFHAIDRPDCRAEGHNPLCGDRVTVFVRTRGEALDELSFEGTGCAISTASASMMTEALTGAPLSAFEPLFHEFQELVTGRGDSASAAERLGKLAAFAGVREFPVRVKCATLPWHTLRAALSRQNEPVTTE